MKQIEFREGEPFCRYNGVLMDGSGCIKTFGCHEEELCCLGNDTVIIDDKIYSDKDFADLIKLAGTYNNETPEWDVIYNQGYEPSGVTERRKIDNTYTIDVSSIDSLFKGIREILPFEQFKKDYPSISLKKYFEFQDDLDKYYKERYE